MTRCVPAADRSPARRSAVSRAAALAFVVSAAAVALAGCGPGEGGTGLPPAASSAPAGAATGVAPVDATAPSTALATVLAADRRADVVGTLTAVGALELSIAGVTLPRSQVDAVLADGRPAPPEALAPGVPAQAWRLGERWLVLLAP